jgi:type VI secretion system protein ImpA
LVRLDGFHGLEQGLTLIKGWLKRYWDTVYPLQDPEDDTPILRINTLGSLNDYALIRKSLNHIPLTKTALGNYSWHDIEIAEGRKPPSKEGESPEMSIIDGAFNETDFEALKSLKQSIKKAEGQIKEITDIVIEKADAINAPDYAAFTSLLQGIHNFIEEKIQYKENLEGISGDDAEEGDTKDDSSANVKSRKAGINNREDVLRAISEICTYFERNEPSSPVPFMLQRAKKMVTMDFMEILKDMTPEGVNQAETICGVKSDQEED